VLENSEHKEAATEFALWMNGSDEGVQSLKDDQGLLPTTNAAWADPTFTSEEFEYLGGQKAREIFAQSAQDSVVGWNWLPFQPYISSVYADTVGQAISGKTDIAEAMVAWQDRIAEYAEEQGFTVTAK
jgi:multiple sugar transport system substrate-binding protein